MWASRTMRFPATTATPVTETDASDAARHMCLLVDRVPSMLAYWDHDLRCRFANRAYERWFGVPPESLIGRTLRELLDVAVPDDESGADE